MGRETYQSTISIKRRAMGVLQAIKDNAAELDNKLKGTPREAGFFSIRSAARRMEDAKATPTPENLFFELIFENELTILFADTGVGKSIFAVQIADEISQNRNVLYIDLELSDKQFEKRYTNELNQMYQFNQKLTVANFSRDFSVPDGISYNEFFLTSLKGAVEQSSARVVIIDNMTALISSDTDSAKDAKPLMDKLNGLKREFNLTLLLLEHTRKTDGSRPISINDLQGSKMKVNFADAAFAIGRSAKGDDMRYVKQLKVRSAEVKYSDSNVAVYCINKRDGNFLHFSFMGCGSETDHLKSFNEEDKAARIDRAKELKSRGVSNTTIANELGVSEGAVRKWFRR